MSATDPVRLARTGGPAVPVHRMRRHRSARDPSREVPDRHVLALWPGIDLTHPSRDPEAQR